MDHRPAMREHIAAISQAIAATDPAQPLAGFLAQRAALIAADVWLRGLPPPREPLARHGITVVALLLAVEDVLRIFPDDPVEVDGIQSPAARLGRLTAQLLPELRLLLDEPTGPPT